MTNEASQQGPIKPPVEVSFKSYSKQPETDDGYELTVTSEADEADVDRTVELAVRGRLMARLAIASGYDVHGRDLADLLEEAVENLMARRGAERLRADLLDDEVED